MFFCRVLARPKERPKIKNDNLPCANAAIFFPCPIVFRMDFYVKGKGSQNPQFCQQDRKRFLVFTLSRVQAGGHSTERCSLFGLTKCKLVNWIKEKETEYGVWDYH